MEESWLATYLRYTEKHESPELFHFWVGVSLISACLGRKTWINRGYYTLYPNFFVVLVAGSARCRKSTAIKIGTKFLKDIDTIKILGGKTTTERFIVDQIFEGPEGVLPPAVLAISDELSVMLTRDPQGDKLIDVLTSLFDCPERFPYRTLSRGEILLRDVFLGVLAGTTDSTLGKVLPDTAFGGGFASRIMFIYQEDTPRRNPFPELSPAEKELEQQLRERLHRISGITGPYTLSEDARSVYREWYGDLEKPDDKRVDGYSGRKHDHALRLAHVLRASQGADGRIIEAGHISTAIKQIELIQSLMVSAFGDVGKSDSMAQSDRVIRYVHGAKTQGIMHSILLKKMYPHLDAPHFRVLMNSLVEARIVARKEDNERFYICLCDDCVKERGAL